MSRTVLVEACVDTIESAAAAAQGGAGRIELCDNLVEGGTTPSAGAIALATEQLGIAVHVMIRPRGGDFCYTELEFATMRRDIAVAGHHGADGVVFGLLLPDGRIDTDRTRTLVEAAQPLSVTFHRAFDVTRDPFEALEALIEVGVDRILTSGQQPSVPEGLELIRSLVTRSAGRVSILPGGGITAANVAAVVQATGVTEVHLHAARAFESPMHFRNPHVIMGGTYQPDEYRRRETAAEQIRNVVDVLATS